MTAFDAGLVVVGLTLAVRGAFVGAVAQLVGLGGALAGLATAIVLVPAIAPVVVDGAGTPLAILTLGLLVAGTAAGQFAGALVGNRMRRRVRAWGASGPDRIAGVTVGIGAYMVFLWVMGLAMLAGPVPALSQLVQRSAVVATVSKDLPPPPDVIGRMAFYLDRQGLPQVYTGPAGLVAAPSVAPPKRTQVAAAAAAGKTATVQVTAQGCGGVSLGSGVATGPEEITTSAHVVAGTNRVMVRDQAGDHAAVPVLFDPSVDLAVLAVEGLAATPLPWSTAALDRETAGAVLGYPGGRRELVVTAASVRSRVRATGRDIYGQGAVERQVLALSADVARGDSGGPFVTSTGAIGGIVFASASGQPDTGYALDASWIREHVEEAGTVPVSTGRCRL